MSSINNKKQIIKIICDELIEERLFAFDVTGHRLIVTGEDPCPIEVYRNEMKYRHDLISHHEEADIILTQQALHCAANKNQIVVVSDDTDVFVLLLHHYDVNCLNITMTMESPSTSKNKTVTDIQLTVEKNKNTIKNILPAHAISLLL